MPTVQFGRRPGRTRGRPGDRATADGAVSVSVLPPGGTSEVDDAQLVTLTNAWGGNFTLTDGTDTTDNIAWNAAAATVETRIETDFASVTAASVAGSAGGPWTISLQDDAGPIDDYVGDESGITVQSITFAETVKGVANTYQVSSAYTNADTGNVTFHFGGNASASTAYNANSATVDTNVQGITGVTDVAVSGSGTSGTPWIITFADPAGNAGALTLQDVDATLAGATTVATPTPGVDNTYEVVNIHNGSTGGNFTLSYGGQTTIALNYDSSFTEIDTALTALSTITDVAVSGVGDVGDKWIITFADPAGNVTDITADDTNLADSSTTIAVATPGVTRVDEIQSIHVGTADGGTFTVTHGGDTTASIAWDAAASAVKSALEAITAITTVNVTGTGSSGDPWLIEFINPSGAEAEVTTTDSLTLTATLTTATDTPGIDAVNEKQTVTLNNGTGGTFTLTYSGQTTSALTWDDTAADVETALEVLSTITAVTVTGDNGGPFLVEFVTPGSADLSMMTATSSLTGAAATVTVAGTVAGVANINETQLFTVDGDTGTYTLSYGGQTTANIAAAANSATIETRLEALSTITAVTVTGSGTRKNPFKVVFVTPEGDATMITATVTSLSNTVVVAARASGSSDDRE